MITLSAVKNYELELDGTWETLFTVVARELCAVGFEQIEFDDYKINVEYFANNAFYLKIQKGDLTEKVLISINKTGMYNMFCDHVNNYFVFRPVSLKKVNSSYKCLKPFLIATNIPTNSFRVEDLIMASVGQLNRICLYLAALDMREDDII